MSTLDDLLSQIDDPDLAEEFKKYTEGITSEADKKVGVAARDAKVAREQAALAKKFPRAMLVAYPKGKLILPDDTSDEALIAALKEKEEELADMGVPIPGGGAPPTPPAEDTDGSSAWGEDPATGRGGVEVRDILNETLALAERNGPGDRLDIIANIAQMTQEQREVMEQKFSPKFPMLHQPPAQLTDLTPIHGAGASVAKMAAVSNARRSGRKAAAK